MQLVSDIVSPMFSSFLFTTLWLYFILTFCTRSSLAEAVTHRSWSQRGGLIKKTCNYFLPTCFKSCEENLTKLVGMFVKISFPFLSMILYTLTFSESYLKVLHKTLYHPWSSVTFLSFNKGHYSPLTLLPFYPQSQFSFILNILMCHHKSPKNPPQGSRRNLTGTCWG